MYCRISGKTKGLIRFMAPMLEAIFLDIVDMTMPCHVIINDNPK